MPNYVKNIVTITGHPNNIQNLKEQLHSDECCFDFDRIIPMPKELNVTAGSQERDAIACAKVRRGTANKTEEQRAAEIRYKTFNELADLGEQYLNNIEKYGQATWYDWRIEHWGTKWNACEAELISERSGELVYSFETAWSAPEEVYLELSNQYPSLQIEVSYADEDLGNNCGTGHFIGGGGSLECNDDLEFACEVWDVDYQEVLEERADAY